MPGAECHLEPADDLAAIGTEVRAEDPQAPEKPSGRVVQRTDRVALQCPDEEVLLGPFDAAEEDLASVRRPVERDQVPRRRIGREILAVA